MAKWVFLNNEFIEEDKALVHFRDLSFQRGYGIFDFFRLVGNEPLFLDNYLDRFYSSAEIMHLAVPYEKTELKKLILTLIQKNQLPGTGIRLGLTGGYSIDGFSLGKPSFVVSQHSFPFPTPEQIKKGITLITYPHQRQLPQVKSIDYLMAIWLQPLRIKKGADDILYHKNELITECPRSNFFIVSQDDVIITPSENVLPGITRKKIIELAKKHFRVEERQVGLEELKNAKEAFITSTTKEVLPVAGIDDRTFTDRKISEHLLELFRSTHISQQPSYFVSASEHAP